MNNPDPESGAQTSRVTITSDTAETTRVRAISTATARRLGFEQKDVDSIALAIDEAVCNVIQHGYEGRSGQPIDLIFEPVRKDNTTGLQVIILDRGRQVKPVEIVGRNLDDLRPGGLGTHIINTIMDEVEYTPREPEGMQLRLVKLMTQDPARQEPR